MSRGMPNPGTAQAALDLLAAAGVEANVRYLPFCLVAERTEVVYNFSQIPYDLHENDFASWSWTDLPAQRSALAELTPPFGLGRRLALGPLRAPLRRLDRRLPWIGARLHHVKQTLERSWARDEPSNTDLATVAQQYQKDAGVRAREYTSYRHVAACQTCDLRQICDGVYVDYVDMFGTVGLRPVRRAALVTDPQHFTRLQRKVVHPFDRAWLTEAATEVQTDGSVGSAGAGE